MPRQCDVTKDATVSLVSAKLLPVGGVPLSSDMPPDRLADDLPDVGWTLMTFTVIAEYLCTDDVNRKDLGREFFQVGGVLYTLAEDDEPVAMQVPLMGWS